MFHYYQPTRIHFGVNELSTLGNICKPYGNTCMLVSTPDAPLQPLYDRVKALLKAEGIKVVHFDKVEPNPTVEIVEAGFHLLKQKHVDFILAVGGGSSIDSAKAIAFTYGKESIDWDEIFNTYDSPFENYESYSDKCLPLISVPTTSGTGSQVTQAAVITRGKEKITFFHADNFSRECILEPELMLTLPKRMSAATGFDAFTHAFESYINPRASYYSEMDSLEAMKLVIENLPKVLAEPTNIEYRKMMCLADTLAGRALANSGASAPHPLSEIIGGIVHLPHGEALAVVFPAFVKQMQKQNEEKFHIVANLFSNSTDLYEAIVNFLQTIGLYKKMIDFEVSRTDFEEILASPILDHLPFGSRSELENILKDSYE
ncbi:MAG: iron-containing alcohol dehydrogenase [Longicatena sp.]